MRNPYTEHSPEDLLEALTWAGRYPDPDLIAECLTRPDELTEPLLAMMASPEEGAYWTDDDPRWYQPIHAGKLLLAYGEPDAFPLFADVLRTPDGNPALEWFDTDLHALGPPGVPTLLEVVQDDAAPSYGRNLAISALRQIADDHSAETRETILEALRSELPPVDDGGQLRLDRDPSPDEIEHWTEVTLALAELQDERSRPRIEALFDEDLIDEFVFGDREAYHDILAGDTPPINYDFDLVEQYERRASSERKFAARTDVSSSLPKKVHVLVDTLVHAGRHPHPDLIRDCVHARDDIIPALLAILREDVVADTREKHWGEDDPRWYRMIHAGLLLLHFREEDALPLFVREYRHATLDDFNQWFENKLRVYGPPAAEPLIDLLHDEDAETWGRIEAAGELSHIGWAHPDTRDTVLNALRTVLPPLRDDGTLNVPAETEDLPHLWATLVHELGRHQDEASRAQIEALFEHGFIEDWMFGNVEEYHQLLRGEGGSFDPASFNVIDYYEDRYEEGEKERNADQRRQRERRDRIRADEETGHYESGTFVRDDADVGRNDPCPCGSGAKYKYCCG